MGIPKYQKEDQIIRWMDAKGMAYFRPMAIVKTEIHHRLGGKPPVKLVTKKPLFPGYLCFCGEMQARIDCRDSGRFSSFIEIPQQQLFVKQLTQFEAAIKINPRLGMGPTPKKGARMRVASGIWQGYEGVFVRVDKHGKFYITLDAMSQAAELEIDAARLEPI